MTPLQGLGGSSALRDAGLLCHKLVDIDRGRSPLPPAIREYENGDSFTWVQRYGVTFLWLFIAPASQQSTGRQPLHFQNPTFAARATVPGGSFAERPNRLIPQGYRSILFCVTKVLLPGNCNTPSDPPAFSHECGSDQWMPPDDFFPVSC